MRSTVQHNDTVHDRSNSVTYIEGKFSYFLKILFPVHQSFLMNTHDLNICRIFFSVLESNTT